MRGGEFNIYFQIYKKRKDMLISGVQPFTMLDYPGYTAAIVFTPGCTMRCGFCHNPEFVLPEKIVALKNNFITEQSFFTFLAARRGLLDGVVVSGGEPTLAADLVEFIKKIKYAGFKVKLDTNGNRTDVLEKLLHENLLDYVAMDFKTSLNQYQSLVGKLVKPETIKNSIELLVRSDIDYEFRSTLIAEIHSESILEEMSATLQHAKKWWLQKFRPGVTLKPDFERYTSFDDTFLFGLAERLSTLTRAVAVRA